MNRLASMAPASSIAAEHARDRLRLLEQEERAAHDHHVEVQACPHSTPDEIMDASELLEAAQARAQAARDEAKRLERQAELDWAKVWP